MAILKKQELKIADLIDEAESSSISKAAAREIVELREKLTLAEKLRSSEKEFYRNIKNQQEAVFDRVKHYKNKKIQ